MKPATNPTRNWTQFMKSLPLNWWH